jgi:membrane protein DedA with SNARE-associated domain
MNPYASIVALALATFASEDLACVSAGLLIQRGQIDLPTGIVGCTVGIFVGDVGLWAIGRTFGRAALAWPWMSRQLGNKSSRDLRTWLDRHAAGAIVGSRFLPGTRVALYVLSGMVRLPAAVFAIWALLGAVLWTPTIVLLTAALGDTFLKWLGPIVGLGWFPRIAAMAVVVTLLKAARIGTDADRRARLAARVARWSRWEFWPMWLFYSPVAAWIALLSVRYRGLSTMTAANPGIPDGGTVGESKSAILEKLPAEWTIPHVTLRPGSVSERIAALEGHIAAAGWRLPLVLKPDVGQRGVGVKLVRNFEDAREYVSRELGPVVAQPYHRGPFEAGIFYYRMPGWHRGRILSITDKHFPYVVGDAVSSIERLIWRHPRCRLQADTFIERHRGVLGDVLPPGARFQLAIAGNHAQGTLFKDGAHLITPELERRVDEIARSFDGFFVGRFDVRYSDVAEFKAGRGLAIVELNGATSESTNIYDPSNSLWRAYRQLFRQWSIVFQIGAANRARGAAVSSFSRLIELARQHLHATVAYEISD